MAVAPSSSLPPFDPMGAQSVFTPTEPEYVAVVEPLLRAPWRGQRTVATGFAVAFSAASALLWAARRLHASLIAASGVALALLLSVAFGAGARHGGDSVIAAVLVWVSWILLLGDDRRPSAGRAVLGVALWMSAVVTWWMAIVALPLTGAGATRSAHTWRARVLAAVCVGIASMASLALSFVRVAWWAGGSAAAGTEVAWWEVWRVAFTIAPLHTSPALPEAGGEPGHVLSVLLLVAVLAFGTAPAWLRLSAAAMLALMAAGWLQWPGWREPLVRWSAWVMTPFVALGLTWASSRATPRWQLAAALGIGAVLAGSALSTSLRPPRGRDLNTFRDWLDAQGHRATASRRPVQFIAEDVLVDSALVAWGHVGRVPQSSAAIARAAQWGATLLAGPSARTHLELLGVRFATAYAIHDPVAYRFSTVAQQLRCTTIGSERWSVLPGLEYTGRIGIEIPASAAGRVVMVIGDALPLQLLATSADRRALPFIIQTLSTAPASALPPEFLLEGDSSLAHFRYIVRAELAAPASGTALVNVQLGRRAPRVIARLSGHNTDARGRICAAPQETDAFWEAGAMEAVVVPLRAASLFGRGWYGAEGAAQVYRWTDGNGAVLVPSARAGAVRVSVEGAPAADLGGSGPDVSLEVNGIPQGTHSMAAGVGTYSWTVSAGEWIRGTNELLLSVSHTVRPADQGSHDMRTLGLRVSRITLTPE